VLGGALIAMAPANVADAYFLGDPNFAARAGAASVTLQTELGPVELAIRAQLEELVGEGALGERDVAGVIAFYEARSYQPAWTADGSLTPTAIDLIDRLAMADTDGLDPSTYLTPSVRFGAGAAPSTGAVAGADIQMSLALAAYTREAYAGRIDPRTISRDIDLEPHYPDTVAALAAIATGADPVGILEGYNPPHAGYQDLRTELARLRTMEPVDLVVVPGGPTLRLGDEDERVAILRTRLELTAPEEGAHIFDEALAEAVRAFQANAGLVTDGIVGPNTLGALNGPSINPEAEIIANMERWRWAPRDFGGYYVNVNVPEFMVRIYDDGIAFHETRVVVGQRSHQTPIFSDEIEHLVVNPFWYVPASIVADEMMPIMRSDPSYFNRNNFDVFVNWQGRVQQVNPTQVDWSRLSASQVSMRQRPGPGNALGRIKFMFPNGHAVYLHDTPSKSLFQRDVRAYSHGCVRVMDPMDFADALLSQNADWNADRLSTLFGNQERQVDLDQHVPVHITYFTAVVDESGTVQFKNDIYGYSAAVREALGLNDTVVAAND
jgi:murein L,D-transpeptidase YcbB/YkuD